VDIPFIHHPATQILDSLGGEETIMCDHGNRGGAINMMQGDVLSFKYLNIKTSLPWQLKNHFPRLFINHFQYKSVQQVIKGTL
jgi:hypothetical protein